MPKETQSDLLLFKIVIRNRADSQVIFEAAFHASMEDAGRVAMALNYASWPVSLYANIETVEGTQGNPQRNA